MTKNEMLKIVEESISKLKEKTFKVFFFVLDTKGNPTSALEYIYQTAYVLKNRGYDVAMLHQEKEFVGVGGWLGEEYASLPHYNVETENVEITPSDFLFIPEIFANVMIQTRKLPCKRVMIVQNFNNLCEFMPPTQTPLTLGITNTIATTDYQAEKVKEFFPEMRCNVVSPSISKVFRPIDGPQKLIVNIVSKNQTYVNQIIKPFYWKNEVYKWVSFRDLRGLSQDLFAEALREAAITIWIDDDTTFGYTLLDALSCGTLVLAKVPNNPSDWMKKGDELNESILWFDELEDLLKLLSSVIRSWTLDLIPDSIYESQKEFYAMFNSEKQSNEIQDAYIDGLFKKRLKEFEEIKSDVENNKFKFKEE